MTTPTEPVPGGAADASGSRGAAYEFYRRGRRQEPDSTEPVDLREWARLLHVDKEFAPGGRYWIVEETLGPRPVGSLLEIGCGSGANVAHMSRYATRLTGADIVLGPHLKRPRPDDFEFAEFNADDDFPFPDGSFDVVVAMMIMEHVFDPFHFCKEVARILRRPGGVFFLNLPLVTSFKRRFSFLRGVVPATSRPDWFEQREWDGGHLHYFSVALIRRLLALYGFRIRSMSSVGRFRRLKNLRPQLFAGELSLACTFVGSPPGEASPA